MERSRRTTRERTTWHLGGRAVGLSLALHLGVIAMLPVFAITATRASRRDAPSYEFAAALRANDTFTPPAPRTQFVSPVPDIPELPPAQAAPEPELVPEMLPSAADPAIPHDPGDPTLPRAAAAIGLLPAPGRMPASMGVGTGPGGPGTGGGGSSAFGAGGGGGGPGSSGIRGAPATAQHDGPAAASEPRPWGPTRGPRFATDPARPDYPATARMRRWEGRVLLHLDIDADGRVQAASVAVSSGREALDQAAVQGARAWLFQPALEDGRPVASSLDVPVDFRLVE